MDDLMVRIVGRLATIHDRLGSAAYKNAAQLALQAIGEAALQEANRRGNEAEGIFAVADVVPIRKRQRTNSKEAGSGLNAEHQPSP